MNLRLAQVIGVHPERRTVELAYLDDGARAGEAQIASGVVGSDSGLWAVPSVPRPSSERQAGGINPSGRTLTAVVAAIHGRPIVLGFVSPLGSQMTFTEQDRAMYRHPSGAYATIGADGSIEVRHPGGAHLRIGAGANETVPAANGWSPPSGSPPQITLTTSGFTLTVEPGGKTTLTTSNTVEMTYTAATMNGPLTVNGNVGINGTLGVQANGGGSTTVNITGQINLTGSMDATGNLSADGEVTAGTIPLTTHKHTGVTTGAGTSGGPTP